jgi:Flp pilus assembly protein TadB
LWQTLNIQRQAKQDVAEAAQRLRNELAAAEERSARELALAQTLHRAEMEAQNCTAPRWKLNRSWLASSAPTCSSSYRSKR